ncbi:hypothetical protein, partial [Burkholderia stagnalis]|uniref:hypothetical protein n=1 Tax=Burkholderia stagnalis TaxID=1503054 RepID=UPI001C8AD0D6
RKLGYLLVHGSILSRVGASTKSGAVQFLKLAMFVATLLARFAQESAGHLPKAHPCTIAFMYNGRLVGSRLIWLKFW